MTRSKLIRALGFSDESFGLIEKTPIREASS